MNFVLTSASLRRDIEYASPGNIALRMDASIPQGSGPFPAAIIVHGGGWVRGDKQSDVEPLFAPLSEAGFAWFSIDYRLTTDWSHFGEAVTDVESAIRYVKAHAAEYRVDSGRIGLVGESAGGQLAAMAALRGAPDTSVRGVVLLYAPTDLVALAKTSEYVPEPFRGAVMALPFADMILSRLVQLSPAQNVRAGMPPFLLIHGTEDPLVPYEQSRSFREKARAVGAECELYPVPGAGHGLRWWEKNGAIARPYKREMVRWLTQQMETQVRVAH
jgi:acetyl esterase